MDPIPGYKTGITTAVTIALNIAARAGWLTIFTPEELTQVNAGLVMLAIYFLGKRMNRHAGDG